MALIIVAARGKKGGFSSAHKSWTRKNMKARRPQKWKQHKPKKVSWKRAKPWE